MSNEKFIICVPEPFIARSKGEGSWVALKQAGASDMSKRWNFKYCTSVGDGEMSEEDEGEAVTTETLLLKLRSLPAQAIFLTKEDWDILKPLMAAPLVPTHSLVREVDYHPRRGSMC